MQVYRLILPALFLYLFITRTSFLLHHFIYSPPPPFFFFPKGLDGNAGWLEDLLDSCVCSQLTLDPKFIVIIHCTTNKSILRSSDAGTKKAFLYFIINRQQQAIFLCNLLTL